MNRALERERVIFDLWARKPISDSDEYAQQLLREFESKGYVSSVDGHSQLSEEGLQYVLNGRDPKDLVELLEDIEMGQEERVFSANAMRVMVDKPFVYEVIREARSNPDRQSYPSVDLGAYEDLEHGVLFGARTHIMIDPLIGQGTTDRILQKLKGYGANVTSVDAQDDKTTKVRYMVGDEERELYLVGTEAMEVNPDIRQMVREGIFSVMMKGWERFRGPDVGDLKDALDHYSTLLIVNGLMLTRWPPEKGIEKIGEGNIEYHTHLSDMGRVATHGLYRKTTKG